MKKFLLAVIVSAMVFMPVFGQISTGEPHSSVIPRTGNRPQAGDFGIYIGGSVTQIMDLVDAIGDDSYNAWGLPIFNFKYYIYDELEFRCGFEFACKSTNEKYKFEDSSRGSAFESSNFTRFLPGVAYHFNKNNILDVYAGAQLPIGWTTSKVKTNAVYDGERYSEKVYQGAFVIGGGLFVGLQAFIADLPIAIGLECGFSGYINAGGIPKTTIISGGTKQVYYDGNEDIIRASRTEAHWGADAAITFSYYFH